MGDGFRNIYNANTEIKRLEAELAEAKEFNRLSAESYDANSRGWQADIAELKIENATLIHEIRELKDEIENLEDRLNMFRENT